MTYQDPNYSLADELPVDGEPRISLMRKKGPPSGLVQLFNFINSPKMRWIDWGTGLACLAIGLVLLALNGTESRDAWFWVGGGALGCLFAWRRPAQRMASRVNPVRSKTSRVPG